jgi:hypothetical protein
VAVAGSGKDVPDAVNIQNARKDYIIPGSSWKGVIRSRMEQIAGYLGEQHPDNRKNYEKLIQNTFGVPGEGKEAGAAGNIRFSDSVVGERMENDMAVPQPRIHIDKFTGGVMSRGLFSEKYASGKLTAEIDILNRNNPEQTCGLLILALRDLALGLVSIGSGYGMGKGFLDVETITIRQMGSGETATICMKDKSIQDEADVLSGCLSSLGGANHEL